MEKIIRKINGREHSVVLTDKLIVTIDDLQEGSPHPNLLLHEWTKSLGEINRRLTTNYDEQDAVEVLTMIRNINSVIDILNNLGAPGCK